MQIAVDVAGFSAGDADELRRAMGAKRSTEKMERLRGRFFAGMAANGIDGELAEKIFAKMLAFANFGFPESHSISFASLVYYSAWFKLYYPAAFCAALLNSQPMGFYSPQSLVADARRHGVLVRGPDVNLGPGRGGAAARPGAAPAARRSGWGWPRCAGSGWTWPRRSTPSGSGPAPTATSPTWPRRVRLTVPQAEALATAGAFELLRGATGGRRCGRPGWWPRCGRSSCPAPRSAWTRPPLPGLTDAELTVADVWATGVSPDSHPIQHLRERLDGLGAIRIDRLDARRPRPAAGDPEQRPPRVLVGGLVTHRQRPATARGVTFVNLEDETGMLNVTCSEGLWARYRTVALGSSALLVRGRLERSPEGVLNLVADRLQRLALAVPVRSRDFR